jgi:hypothetical protein
MSKGYGVVQRRVLAHLAQRRWVALSELAGDSDASRYESTRRAVAELAAAGVVETRMDTFEEWHQLMVIRRQESQRSHALLETPPVRHRVPTADRRRSQTKGGPGRTLGGGSIVSRGQLIPRTPALQTSHFPSPPPNPTTGKNRLLDTERRQHRAPTA